ncbi:MAG: NADPH-dependent assimilatory sulfite reductase hemoprotein subunit [Planctomycetota bacterium]
MTDKNENLKPAKPSKVEKAKTEGDLLRGTIDEVLRDESVDKFEHDDLQLLKFHGSYQQDDRDLRKSRRAEGLGKAYSFMIRIVLPGGVMTPEQYLAVDRIADEYANGTIRITTRQAIQYHGVIKGNLRETMRQINEALMTTLAACGDVCRNVMATAPPFQDAIHTRIRETANEIAADLRPATRAYHEIWIDGERIVDTKEDEPFYGETYLPRKYKVGVTLMGDNQMDIYSYDAGLIGIVEDNELAGFNVVAGGGLGMSHGRANTFAQIADQIGFVGLDDGVAVIRNIASIYRDFGNRENRKQARLKYLINEYGIDWFVEQLKERSEFTIQPWKELPETRNEDWMGQHRQDSNHWFYGVFVENGRVKDEGDFRLKTALRSIIEDFNVGVTLTAQQSLLLTHIKDDDIAAIKKRLSDHGVKPVEQLPAAIRYSMACPAMPTCGMAVAESERASPEIVRDLAAKLDSIGLADVPLTFRMTGCPNGCARPYTADVALVGRRPGIYHIFVGGRLAGDRMADLFAADVAVEEVIPTLTPLLNQWSKDRSADEGLGDFYQRTMGRRDPRRRVTGKEESTIEQFNSQLVQLNANAHPHSTSPPSASPRTTVLPVLPMNGQQSLTGERT